MTVCNMSIEGGARAGHDRAGRHDVRVRRGPAGARRRARSGSGRRRAGARCRPTTAHVTTASRRGRRRGARPQVTWGTNPGMVAPVDGRVPDPADVRRRRRPRGGRARARVHGRSSPGTPIAGDRASTASSSAPARTRASRTCARPRRSSRGRQRRPERPRDGRPGLRQVKRQAEEEGLDRVFERRRLRVAPGRLLDVPRHEPRHPRAGRALRLDVEPQLRGAAGRGRPHASRLARRWPRRPRSRAISSTCASWAGAEA